MILCQENEFGMDNVNCVKRVFRALIMLSVWSSSCDEKRTYKTWDL